MKIVAIIALALCAIGASSAQTTRTYEYDALGRLKKVTTSAGASATYSYDAADNRTAVVVVAGSPNPPPTSTKVVVVPLGGFLVIPIP